MAPGAEVVVVVLDEVVSLEVVVVELGVLLALRLKVAPLGVVEVAAADVPLAAGDVLLGSVLLAPCDTVLAPSDGVEVPLDAPSLDVPVRLWLELDAAPELPALVPASPCAPPSAEALVNEVPQPAARRAAMTSAPVRDLGETTAEPTS